MPQSQKPWVTSATFLRSESTHRPLIDQGHLLLMRWTEFAFLRMIRPGLQTTFLTFTSQKPTREPTFKSTVWSVTAQKTIGSSWLDVLVKEKWNEDRVWSVSSSLRINCESIRRICWQGARRWNTHKTRLSSTQFKTTSKMRDVLAIQEASLFRAMSDITDVAAANKSQATQETKGIEVAQYRSSSTSYLTAATYPWQRCK
jgi:hypothetical protein